MVLSALLHLLFSSWGASLFSLLGTFPCIFESERFRDGDLYDLCFVKEPIDKSDNAACVWKHLAPLGERLVGSDDDRLVLIAAGDEFEEEVCVFA